jgi:hypothetical protein
MKIELTDGEIEVVMKALHHFAGAPHSVRNGVGIDEINEISDDIREQDCRRDDGWNDRENDAIPAAADRFIQAGIDAREMLKARQRAHGLDDSAVRTGSLAAQRRQAARSSEACARMMAGTVAPFVEED